MTIYETLRTKALSEFTESEMSDARNLAYQILRADYYGDVRNVTKSIMDAIKDGEITDAESLDDRIHEECDGTQRVIYTAQAIECLLISSNDSAHADEFGDEGMIKDGSINWSGIAFSAFRQDVIEDLQANEVDLNDPCAEDDEDEMGFIPRATDGKGEPIEWACDAYRIWVSPIGPGTVLHYFLSHGETTLGRYDTFPGATDAAKEHRSNPDGEI
jgi:hypothetical protein